MEIKIRYKFVPQHKDGHYIDLYSQPVHTFSEAVHFVREDDLNRFLLGRYGPDDPQNFRSVRIKVTEEVESHVQQE